VSVKLTRRERRFLELLAEAEDATIAIGMSVGSALCRRRLVKIATFGKTWQDRDLLIAWAR
jgi:hypothetical protein